MKNEFDPSIVMDERSYSMEVGALRLALLASPLAHVLLLFERDLLHGLCAKKNPPKRVSIAFYSAR